jgi:ATP:cob(I)alamin adenosyltransferase
MDKSTKLYTKTGDNGTTSLAKIQNVAKDDDRVELLGIIDEFTSHLGVAKTMITKEELKAQLEDIQKNLMTIMAGIADSYNQEYKLKEDIITEIEQEIDRVEALFPRPKRFVLPGENPISAQLDVARTVVRRAERQMNTVDRKFSMDKNAKRYFNRLADYLYVNARYIDFLNENKNIAEINGDAAHKEQRGMATMNENQIISAVMEKLSFGEKKINLNIAKELINRIEEEAKKRGLNAVIAICGNDGNVIAVHVMDNSFLASFDIAMKKAYTSVAVKMSTKELGELAQPGGTFYGVDKADNNRLIIFGGGIPLKIGETIIGGLGISGGISEVDHSLAEFGAEEFIKLI